jgi:maltose/moltooligosaccharide transporter
VPFLTLLSRTPKTMMQLAVTQFFSWFALFLMWVYTTNAIALKIWGTADANTKDFNEAGNWTGVIFAAYSVFAALFSLAITPLAEKYGRKNIYMIALLFGGMGLIAMNYITNKYLLFIPMIGVGVAWAAILALPYAILSTSLPPKQTGVYMGIFNATITFPQIAAGLLGGVLLSAFGGNAMGMIVLAGVSMLLAGISAKLVVKE